MNNEYKHPGQEEFPYLSMGFYTERGHPQYDSFVAYFKTLYFPKCVNGYIYLYENGFYHIAEDLELCHRIDWLTKKRVQPSHYKNFILKLKSDVFLKESRFESSGLINLSNGILNVRTQDLIEHNPRYFFKYKLPHEFKENAQCPNFMEFLNFVFQNDQELVNQTAEIFGYCLAGGEQWLHRAFVLYGDGRNGKSTWLDILKILLGKDNIAAVSLSLIDKPFSCISLVGKLANIVGESPSDKINAEIFKEATSGGTVRAAFKGKDEFDFRCDARFIFAANKLPNFNEANTGIMDRLIFLPFNKYIREKERSYNVVQTIVENEMSGVLNFSLEGLKRLISRGYMEHSQAHEKTMNEYRKEADSVFDWISECIEWNEKIQRGYTTDVLFQFYNNYCDQSKRKGVSRNSFGKRLAKHFRDVLEDRFESFEYESTSGVDRKKKGYRGIVVYGNTVEN